MQFDNNRRLPKRRRQEYVLTYFFTLIFTDHKLRGLLFLARPIFGTERASGTASVSYHSRCEDDSAVVPALNPSRH
jgi:hypothetical protein